MKKIVFFLTVFGIVKLLISPVETQAVETMFFDSTDKYLGACQLTNKSEWELKDEVAVSKFEVWYNWGKGETELPVKLYKDKVLFAEFVATRASCDPYQQQWCNADYSINKVFPKGKYSTEIPNSRQCLKPGGTGTIRLYKDDGVVPTSALSPTVAVTSTIAPLVTSVPQETIAPSPTVKTTTTNSANTCNCNNRTIVTTAAVTSGITSIIVWLILGRK